MVGMNVWVVSAPVPFDVAKPAARAAASDNQTFPFTVTALPLMLIPFTKPPSTAVALGVAVGVDVAVAVAVGVAVGVGVRLGLAVDVGVGVGVGCPLTSGCG